MRSADISPRPCASPNYRLRGPLGKGVECKREVLNDADLECGSEDH